MTKKIITIALAMIAISSSASRILWAALDESSTIDGVAFRSFENNEGLYVNAARLSISNSGSYSMDSVTPLALYIPAWEDEPAYWETEWPVTCLRDENGTYPMGIWSSQFNLGDNPNLKSVVFFELGYVNWYDDTSPFITLATANATIQDLTNTYTYESGSIAPPGYSNWMPTNFHAVPEPSTAVLAMLGTCLLLKRRKNINV